MAKIKETLYNDGESLDYTDLNEMQRFMRSQLFDSVLGSMAWNNTAWEHSTYPDVSQIYALRAGGEAYYAGSGGVSIAVNPGLLAIATVASWGGVLSGSGDDVNLISAYYEGGLFTFGANATGNPRWDILQATIANVEGGAETRDFSTTGGVLSSQSLNKTRTATITVSVKAGTAAASPVEPTPDAGYVKLAAIRLNDGYAGGTARPDDLRDYRIPLGASAEKVIGRNMARTGTWADTGTTPIGIIVPASVQSAYAVPVQSSVNRRLMRVGLAREKIASSTGAVLLGRLDYAGIWTSISTLTASLMVATGVAYEEYSLAADAPVWSNGRGGRNIAQLESIAAVDDADSTLALAFTSDGTRQDALLWARFIFAGGF